MLDQPRRAAIAEFRRVAGPAPCRRFRSRNRVRGGRCTASGILPRCDIRVGLLLITGSSARIVPHLSAANQKLMKIRAALSAVFCCRAHPLDSTTCGLTKVGQHCCCQPLRAVAFRHVNWPQNRAYFTRIYQFAIYNLEWNLADPADRSA